MTAPGPCPNCGHKLRRCSGPKMRVLLVTVIAIWIFVILAVSFINGNFEWMWEDYYRGARVFFVGVIVVASGFAAIVINEK